MTILHVNKFFYPKGGSETYFFALSHALEEAGHTVVHFSMKDDRNLASPYSDFFVNHIDFRGTKTAAKALQYISSREAVEKVTALVREAKPDIAHVHNIAHQLTPTILTTLQSLGVPVVQTLHDYQLICPNYQLYTQNETCERCMQHRYWNAITHTCVQDSVASSTLAAIEMMYHNVLKKSYANGVQRFIAPSKFLHETLVRWGWHTEQLVYLPHFTEKLRVTGIQKKQQVVFVGRLTDEKGVHLLLDAAARVKNIDILFAGEGEERARMEETIAKKELSHCQFLGFQSGEALDRLMQESLAVVVPSLWYENAPLVVYEALALGTPVIAANHGGLPELIQHGKNGWLFHPGDAAALAECLQFAQTAEPLQIAENQYKKETHIRDLLALYDAILRT